MKKLLVALTVMAFLVGLAVPALAEENGYHEVYKYDYATGMWVLTDDCEMFSQDSDSDQYRWESAEGVGPCYPYYVEPTPEAPVQFDIMNHAHLFPWIEAHITETHLTWDIFKPGDYMAKTFIIQLKANCPVQIHLGGGTWDIPAEFVDGKLNGHIDPGPFTKEGDENMMGDKLREYSLLGKDDISGTPPDEIEVRWWCYTAHGVKPPAHEITDAEFALMPPKADWPLARDSNCTSVTIPDSEELHVLDNTHVVFFEDLFVEQCDSEGKYVDLFAVTITADP